MRKKSAVSFMVNPKMRKKSAFRQPSLGISLGFFGLDLARILRLGSASVKHGHEF
jgi:hypothetical protein